MAGFLAQTSDFAGAIDACNTAISLFPRRATSHYKLGAVLTKKRDPIGAVNAYKRAIELRPDWPQPWAGLAQAHVFSGSHALAENAARRALSLDPNLASAHNHLGLALAWQGLPTQAVQAYLRSIEIDSSRVETRANLASARLQSLEQAEAISLYRQTLLMRPDDLELASNLLFARNYVHIGNELELFEEHRRWGARLAEGCACDARSGDGGCAPGASLRVGYVSPDLCDHPVARFIEPILAGHRRRVIEPVVYNDALRADKATRHLKGLVSEWHDVAQMSNSELAERVRRDRIDILIDLAGHTAGNRLRMFALKPAPVPVQITYLGYPNTTGLPSNIMNYRLTDSLCDPPGETDAFHTEKLVRLLAPFLCYQPPADAPDPRDAPALRNGYITFGCFNAMAKTTRWVIERWSEILRRVDDSKILLKNRSLADQVLRERVRAEFDRHGISQDRVLLSGHEPTEHAHLSRYHEVDIALDTFPYHGTTTTCEALWIGVPVITLVGQAHRSRVGLTLLSDVGLEEFAPTTPKDYIDCAVALAREPERLATSRRALRSAMQASALLDRSKFICGLEAALLACFNK